MEYCIIYGSWNLFLPLPFDARMGMCNWTHGRGEFGARGVMLLPPVMISMKNIPYDGIRQTRSDNELIIQALL